MCKKFATLMKNGGVTGSIINFSSQAAKGAAMMVDYSASKGGVEAMTKSMAKELGPLGIRVNAVLPGVIDTPQSRLIPEDLREQCINHLTPLGRVGRPEEVANLVGYLADDCSGFCTGSVFEIAGGFTV